MFRRPASCISSGYTRFHKRVFPVFWFGITLIILIQLWFENKLTPLAALIGLGMMFFGLFLMKKTLWDLADDVRDFGSFLLVRRNGLEEKIMLSNILSVSESARLNPSRITLLLEIPGIFGQQIAFAPVRPFSWNPLTKSRIGADLAERVEAAHGQKSPF